MDCEICGNAAGKGKKILLDGGKLIVCDECASFGEEIIEEEKPAKALAAAVLREKAFSPVPEKEFDLGLDIVPDFGKIVRKARELKGLTVKELAIKIFERESLLHRIENQSIRPSDEIIKKLEKELKIELKQKTPKE